MFPEEFKSTLLRLAEENEDMKTLLGLFHLAKGYTTEETLVKNFTAITGKDCTDLLKVLRRKGILKIGTHNDYLCLSGYEEFFDEITGRYLPQPGDFVSYFEKAAEAGDLAKLKMIDLLLKIGKHGTPGLTQYESIRKELSELFSLEAFHAIENDLLRERLCLYGKKREQEFLELYQSEDTKKKVKEQLQAWKANQLAVLPIRETLEKEIDELIKEARWIIKPWSTKMAEQAAMTEQGILETTGYFTGFEIDKFLPFLRSYILLGRDTLYIALTDTLSRHDVVEWKDFPVIFIADEIPKWINDLQAVFKNAYPKLSERKIAIAVPNKGAYANFKQNLLSELMNHLGISEISEFPK